MVVALFGILFLTIKILNMRFITEFELLTNFEIENYKSIRQRGAAKELGEDISTVFGWQVKGETTLHGPVAERHTLDIEAFPMDKWIEFKIRLLEHIEQRPGDAIGALQLIKNLEFINKEKLPG